ncbi:MAG: RraA family protein [Balneolaceae bacterium]
MKEWKNDDELFELMRTQLYTAVVGDIMDKHDYTNQFLPPKLRPLRDDMMVAGRALPVIEADVDEPAAASLKDKAFGLMLEALDDLKKNEVYICTGASPSYALWGELMSTRAIQLGSAGAVVDGYSRDTKGVLKLNFPTFSYGSYSQDQLPRGKVIDFRVPISMGGVTINPGDIIFGDLDGVCVIPQEIENEVITDALKKAGEEKTVQKAIENGMGACEAFEKFGVM